MKIFLASSRESEADMHNVARLLEEKKHETVRWDSPGTFAPGTYPLRRLIEISREVDAAVFIFSEDDKVWYRDSELRAPRDNVLMEYGLFVGTLGPERAIICRKGRAKTPTDLEGLVHINISEDRVESARAEIVSWLSILQNKRGIYARPLFTQEYVRVLADNRKVLDADYRERKYGARNVDILGMALSGALIEMANDEDHRMLRRVLFDGVQVRMIFITPTSEYVKQRAVEDGDSLAQLQGLLRNSVLHTREVYERFARLYEQEEKAGQINPTSIGSLEIRVIDFCPHFTIYRTDDSILWGIYTATTRGLYSSVLEVQKSHDSLFRQIVGHFDSLWKIGGLDRSPDKTFLLKCDSYMPPILNERLVEELLRQ